jgi:hypothetical protein
VPRELSKPDDQIARIVTVPDVTARSAQAFYEVTSELSQLRTANTAYETRESYDAVLADACKKVNENSANMLKLIEKQIKTSLRKVDGSFTAEQRRPPELQLEKIDSYKYSIADDSGTGSGYRKLLSFDLAMLEHSMLQVIVEDSYLF